MDVDDDEACNIPLSGQTWEARSSPCHKEMYKRTPKSWKAKFRQACMHRLRQSRGKLVERLRGAESGEATAHEARGNEFIDDLMKEEFKQIKRLEMSPNIFCDCCSDKHLNDNDDGIENIFQLMDEIREELMKEEQIILQEYNELETFDKKYINAAINCLGAEYVICPVCKRNQLLQNKQVLFCSCGLRIDTGYDGITLANVSKQIDDSLKEHCILCSEEPVFSVLAMDELDLHNLTLSCKVCHFMAIVV